MDWKPRTLILFSYYFPPDEAIGGARPFRFYRYLTRMGVECQVYTASRNAGSISSNITEIPDNFENPSVKHDLGWHLERSVRRFIGAVGTRWALKAYRAAQEFSGAISPDRQVTILSTFPPIGAHLAAWLLARHRSLPWIADFRDPLTRPGNTTSFGPSRLERYILRTASLSLANTEEAAGRLQRLYPDVAPKIRVMWNGFDPEQPVTRYPLESTSPKRLSHVGALYGGRSVTPLLQSLTRLVSNGRLSPGQVRLYVAGEMDEESIPVPALLRDLLEAGWLEWVPRRIPEAEARNVMARSHGLVLIQPQSALQVPGKLFDYVRIGRPVLAYIARQSPVEMILKRSGIPHRCIYPDTSPSLVDETLLEFIALPLATAEPSDWFNQHFSAERQTRELVGYLDSLRQI
jgi:Glycosyl transferase 4-like domain